MSDQPSLLTRRRLSPEKLRDARLRAGFDNISDVARRVKVRRLAYSRWESHPGLLYFDFLGFRNVLVLFGVSYEDVTDEMAEDAADDLPPDLPTAASPITRAPA